MPNLQQIFEIPTSACLHAFLLSSLKTAFLGGLEVRGLGRQVAFLVCGNLLYVGLSQQLDAVGSPGEFLDCSMFPGHMK